MYELFMTVVYHAVFLAKANSISFKYILLHKLFIILEHIVYNFACRCVFINIIKLSPVFEV